MSWEKKTLDQLGEVSRGKSKHRPRNDVKLFGGKYPFIQTADVKDAELYITEYSQTYNDFGLSQSKLWDVGTLCITIAANIADTAILGIPACFPDSIMGFIPYENISDVRFMKYCFDLLQRECKQISQGTAQDNLSWKKLSTIKFPVPSYEVQKRIANVLGTYDDLIENNKKQIKLLEEMAQRVYKEWFVDLHFPGYEDVEIVDGVPEGWSNTQLDMVGKFIRGKTITKAGTVGGNVAVVAGGKEPAYYNNISNTEAPVITISASGANAGFVRMYYERVWASDCSYVDKNNTDYIYYLYCFLKNSKTRINNLQKGAAQPHVYAKDINAMEILVAPSALIISFESVVEPVFAKIKNCNEIIKRNIQVRDRLLPFLMAGELEV